MSQPRKGSSKQTDNDWAQSIDTASRQSIKSVPRERVSEAVTIRRRTRSERRSDGTGLDTHLLSISKICAKNMTSLALNPLDLMHSDVCEPVEIASIGGSHYFLTLVDDAGRNVSVCFLEPKSQVCPSSKHKLSKRKDVKMKILRTDTNSRIWR